MNKRSGILRIIGTLLALVLLIYLLSQQGWEDIWAAVKNIPLWRVLLAIALMAVSRFSVAARWYVLLRSSKARISFSQSLRITFAGMFSSNFLPTTIGGDVIRMAGALQLNLDSATSAASLIVDRLVGLAGMAMAVPLGIPSFMAASQNPSGAISLFSGAIGLPFGKWWKTAWNKGRALLRRLTDALAVWIKHPRSLLLALAFSWLHMLCIFIILYQFLAGMGESLSPWVIGGLYSLVYFVTLLPISINGLGVQEISMTFFLSSLGGTSVNSSLTVALLFRTLMMLASLPGALFVPGMLAHRDKKNLEDE